MVVVVSLFAVFSMMSEVASTPLLPLSKNKVCFTLEFFTVSAFMFLCWYIFSTRKIIIILNGSYLRLLNCNNLLLSSKKNKKKDEG